MKLPDFLTEWPYGEIVLTGHRIRLFGLGSQDRAGPTPEETPQEFPTLSPELIARVLEFYRANQAEVDAYVADYQEKIDHLRATTPRAVNPEELRRQLEERKRTGA